MNTYELDPEVARWGLHHVDVCSPTNNGSPQTVTCYEVDWSRTESVEEGFLNPTCSAVENDEVIAYALQEELSRLAVSESSESASFGEHQQNEPILARNWQSYFGNQEEECTGETVSSNNEERYTERGYQDFLPELEGSLDGEFGKRLSQMVPVPHVPKINGEIPSADEATSDHQRLLNRLQLYDLVEIKILGDGNCQLKVLLGKTALFGQVNFIGRGLIVKQFQNDTDVYPFRSLSDQIYRSPEHHDFVREQVVKQLKSQPELYENYVPMAYGDYLKKMSKSGEWGDHITLQAGADWYGIKIFVITSFKDTCYIEILPQTQNSDRTIFLSFWAEVHYNSIYPLGELPTVESKKTKKWLW